MAAESALLDSWLYALLSGDAALAQALATLAGDPSHPQTWAGAWWPDEAAEATPYPLGVWTWTFPGDIWAQGGERAAVPVTLRLVVIAPTGDYSDLAPVADRLDALLHGAQVATGPIRVFQCLRTQEIRRTGLLAGVRYRQLGAEYALLARSNP